MPLEEKGRISPAIGKKVYFGTAAKYLIWKNRKIQNGFCLRCGFAGLE